MSSDTIAIVVAGTVLARPIAPGLRERRRGVADLRERMARFEGFTRREPATPGTGTA